MQDQLLQARKEQQGIELLLQARKEQQGMELLLQARKEQQGMELLLQAAALVAANAPSQEQVKIDR